MPILLGRKGGGGGGGAPSGPAGGSLSGTYPNPTIAALAVDTAELAAGAVTAAKVAADVATQAELDAVAATIGMAPIFDSTLGADAATIDTGAGAIPGTYAHLRIICYLRATNAAVTGGADLTFNNDTGANYDREVIRVSNTTVSGVIALASAAFGFLCPGASAQAGAFGATELVVPAYAQTTGHKTFTGGANIIEDTAADCRTDWMSGRWRSTSAITRVTITAQAAANFLAGSRMTIYGMRV